MSRFFLFLLLGFALNVLVVRAQGVYDYENLTEARMLLSPKAATASFPKGGDGRPDWVRVLGQGLITPRSTKTGAPRPPEDWGDAPKEGIVFSNTLFMPFVVFPHQPHAEWLACSNCHDGLFERQATGKGKGMTAIFRGEHCGFCHGRVAFSPEGSCYRCHSKPNPAALQNNSPFTSPANIEQPAVADDEEDKPRRRGAKKVPMAGRLAPSVVPPPAPTITTVPGQELQ